jgi:hypothetical protein
VIRDAVLHLQNEQPLLVDIFEIPSPSDTVRLPALPPPVQRR